ncbi:hypothetical protein CFBP2533_18230 [Xanthomonas hortorum pv. pelargonii]|uniref:Uncharacterized protein n=1 Tax=Xanthomonas hortorum pv. pelargonii TaxID=453602 RepID=A0A6V7CZJ9_9XANT|nr:hypothetical protein CFBP2533_18230 [Xanthomonas hortorum pv. pelargonii]CAD0324811.1 hypothetical protein CFBP2533_18230 [Xanthomonas hortorum pv. pelargonii]
MADVGTTVALLQDGGWRESSLADNVAVAAQRYADAASMRPRHCARNRCTASSSKTRLPDAA